MKIKTKILMINKYINRISLATSLIICGCFSILLLATTPAQAVSFSSPAKSIVNPLTQTVYVVNNGTASDTAKIEVYDYGSYANGGIAHKSTLILNDVTAGTKCYGLAVTPDGKQLLVSLNKGAQSKFRAYTLDSSGFPIGFTNAGGDWPLSSSNNPQGIAMNPNGVMAYVVDGGAERIYTFYYTNNDPNAPWTYFASTEAIPDLIGIYDAVATMDKLFVSRKTNPGKIFIFDIVKFFLVPTSKPVASLEGISFPTNLKISPDGKKLYVAVNGATASDILVYDLNNLSSAPKKISNPNTSGAYGWSGFDLSPDGDALFYTQAQDANESTTKLYKATGLLTLAGDKTASYVKEVTKSDGVVIFPDREYMAVSYSGDGSLQGTVSIPPNATSTGLGVLAPVVESISPVLTQTDTATTYITIKGKYFLAKSNPALYVKYYPGWSSDFVTLGNASFASPNEVSGTLSKSQVEAILKTKSLYDDPITKKLGVKVLTNAQEGLLANAFEIKDPAKAPVVSATDPLQQNQADSIGVESSLKPGKTVGSKSASLVFRFKMTDPNYASQSYPFKLTPRVKIVRTGATSRPPVFEGTPVTYDGSTPVEGKVVVPLSDAYFLDGSYTYNWQAEVADESTLVSSWVDFTDMVNAVPKTYDFSVDKAPTIVTPPPTVSNLQANAGNAQVSVTWTNPIDPAFDGVLIIRGPSEKGPFWNPNPGKSYAIGNMVGDEIVVYNGKGQNTIDATVVNDTTYYYRAFTYDKTLHYSDATGPVAATPRGAPIVESVMPNGTVGSSGQFVSIKVFGKNFYDIENVLFASSSGSNFGNEQAIQNWPKNPASSQEFSAGAIIEKIMQVGTTYKIKVKTIYGEAAGGSFKIYVPGEIQKPTISKIYPAKIVKNTEAKIIIEGTGFASAYKFYVNKVPSNNMKVLSDTIIEATITKNLTKDLSILPASSLQVPVHVENLDSKSNPSDITVLETPEDGSVAANVPQASNFKITNGDTQSTLSWGYPNDTDLAEVRVVRSAKNAIAYPKTDAPTAIVVYPKTGESSIPKPGETISGISDGGLENDQSYRYVVYLRDTSNLWSAVKENENAGIGKPSKITEKPGTPQNLTLIKDGNNVILKWSTSPSGPVPEKYYIYRAEIPAKSAILNINNKKGELLQAEINKGFTDNNAVSESKSYYYLVTAVIGAQESDPSNMGYMQKTTYTPIPNAVSNMYWISVPYNTPYKNAADIAKDINGTKTPGEPGTCKEVGKFDTATGATETLTWFKDESDPTDLGVWSDQITGDDKGFTITPGNAYYVSVVGSTAWSPTGSDDPNFKFNLQPAGTNMFWISLPYNSDYGKVRDIVDHINENIATDKYIVTEIGKYDPATGITETLTWFKDPSDPNDPGAWSDQTTSDDKGFNFTPGEGYYISITNPLIDWMPKRKP